MFPLPTVFQWNSIIFIKAPLRLSILSLRMMWRTCDKSVLGACHWLKRALWVLDILTVKRLKCDGFIQIFILFIDNFTTQKSKWILVLCKMVPVQKPKWTNSSVLFLM